MFHMPRHDKVVIEIFKDETKLSTNHTAYSFPFMIAEDSSCPVANSTKNTFPTVFTEHIDGWRENAFFAC